MKKNFRQRLSNSLCLSKRIFSVQSIFFVALALVLTYTRCTKDSAVSSTDSTGTTGGTGGTGGNNQNRLPNAEELRITEEVFETTAEPTTFNNYSDPLFSERKPFQAGLDSDAAFRGQTPTSEEIVNYSTVPEVRRYRGAVNPAAPDLWYDEGNWSLFSTFVRKGSDIPRSAYDGSQTILLDQETLNRVVCSSALPSLAGTDNELLESIRSTSDGKFVVAKTLHLNEATCDKESSRHFGRKLPVLISVTGGNQTAKVFYCHPGAAIIMGPVSGITLSRHTNTDGIIFTHIDDPLDGSKIDGSFSRWEGVYVIGKASINQDGGTETVLVNREKITYGGSNDQHLTFRNKADKVVDWGFISIRYATQGLVLAGLGNRNSISNIEITHSQRGLTLLGGTVNLKNVLISNVLGTAIYYDKGYRGIIDQFIISATNKDSGTIAIDGRGGSGDRFSKPLFIHGTLQGNESSSAIRLSQGAGGLFYNCIISDYRDGVIIERGEGGDTWPSYTKGNIVFKGNLFHNIAETKDPSKVFTVADTSAPTNP